jgi:hypothetical protein
MLRFATVALVAVLVGIAIAAAQPSARDEVVELIAGDRLVIRADGTMSHYDVRGIPMSMQEGVVMTGKDGSRLIMKRQSLWREVLETAGSAYAMATAESYLSQRRERTIELEDGGRVTIDRDGTMAHNDRSGNPMSMVDGQVMIAKDGSRILMVNRIVWREVAKPRAAPP